MLVKLPIERLVLIELEKITCIEEQHTGFRDSISICVDRVWLEFNHFLDNDEDENEYQAVKDWVTPPKVKNG